MNNYVDNGYDNFLNRKISELTADTSLSTSVLSQETDGVYTSEYIATHYADGAFDQFIRSLTVSQLNFVPLESNGDKNDIIATINASSEGITIDADNITISGSTTFSSGYDPTSKVDEVGGNYSSAATGSRVLIFPDANTGIQVIDNATNDVFKVIVGGTDVGDVIIGDSASNKYIKWDKSVATLTLGSAAMVDDRLASTLADAIDSSGHFVDANINTSTKNILADFTFGVSGALQIGAYVNGVSGDIRISPNGIVGRNSAGTNTFTLDGTTGAATFAGTLSAAAGTLGSITAGSFSGITIGIGTGDSIFKADSNGIYLGDATFADAPFRVSMAGALVSTSATITGAITATSGSIGSFTIGTYLYTGSKTAYNDANAGIHIGSDGIGIGNNVFTVSSLGALVAKSATIGNWSVNATSIYTGTEDHSGYTANAGDITIYSDGSDASIHAKNFYIDSAGSITATSATISGSITITSGSGIANLTDAGDLATADTADFSTQVSGATKPANNATVGATWGTDLSNIPATLGTPSGSGLFLSSTNMGYYTGGAWKTYFDSSGNMVLGDIAGGNTGMSWNQAGGTLTIKGAITADSGTIGSFTIGTYLYTGSKTAYNDANAGVHLGSDGIGFGNNIFTVSAAGALVAKSATIGNWSVNTTSIYTGTEDHSGYTANAGDITIYSDGSDASIHAKNFYIDSAGSITCTSATVTGALTTGAGSTINGTYIDSLDVGKLNAGSITSKAITLAISAGTGDAKIQAGKTDFTNTETGFILGLDDSDSDLPKLYIGTSTAYMNWTGSALNLVGSSIDVSTIGNIRGGQTDYDTGTGFFLGYSGSAHKFSIGGGTATNNTGFVNPTRTYSPLNFTNPGNIYSSNNSYATETTDGETQVYGGFDFSIPSGATILGIEVVIEGHDDHGAGTPSVTKCQLSYDNGSNWTSQTDYSWTTTPDTTDSTYSFGTTNYLWGRSWTLDEVVPNQFKVRLEMDASNDATTVSYDHVKVKIYYSTASEFLFDGSDVDLSGGTITGGTIKTSATGRRVELTSDLLRSYDSSEIKRVEVDSAYMTFYDSSGNVGGQIYGGFTSQLLLSGTIAILENALVGDYTGTTVNYLAPSYDNKHTLGTSSLNWDIVYTFEVNASGSGNLHLEAAGDNITCGVSLYPDENNTHSCGNNDYAWGTVYSYNYVDKCLWLDEEDDLQIIQNMKPQKDKSGNIVFDEKTGKPKLDNNSFPDWMTVKSGDDQPFRNLGHTVDLLLGAIRKLTERIEKLEGKE